MAGNSHSRVITFLILTGLFAIGSALHCFVCNSGENSDCGESPPPKKYVTQCSDHPVGVPPPHINANNETVNINETLTKHLRNFVTVCRMKVSTISAQDNGNSHSKPATTRIQRSCGWMEKQIPENSICKTDHGDGVSEERCVCVKAECNGSSSIFGNFRKAVFTGILGLLLVYSFS